MLSLLISVKTLKKALKNTITIETLEKDIYNIAVLYASQIKHIYLCIELCHLSIGINFVRHF
jgi:hypothetical protein